MSYRQKSCLYCSTPHKKRGPYCGKVCSNKHRKHTPETKEKMSQSQSVAQRTHTALENSWHARTKGQLKAVAIRRKETLEDVNLVPEDIYLPPMKPELPDGVTRVGDDLWYDVDR